MAVKPRRSKTALFRLAAIILLAAIPLASLIACTLPLPAGRSLHSVGLLGGRRIGYYIQGSEIGINYRAPWAAQLHGSA